MGRIEVLNEINVFRAINFIKNPAIGGIPARDRIIKNRAIAFPIPRDFSTLEVLIDEEEEEFIIKKIGVTRVT